MKLSYGRGINRDYDVDIKTDFFIDNGACIQLVTKDVRKIKFVNWHYVSSWFFSKTKFQKLLKNNFIEKVNAKNKNKPTLTYYRFTKKANDYEEVFR